MTKNDETKRERSTDCGRTPRAKPFPVVERRGRRTNAKARKPKRCGRSSLACVPFGPGTARERAHRIVNVPDDVPPRGRPPRGLERAALRGYRRAWTRQSPFSSASRDTKRQRRSTGEKRKTTETVCFPRRCEKIPKSIGDAERAAARARGGIRALGGVDACAEDFSHWSSSESRRNPRRTCTTSRPPTHDGHRVSPVSRAKKLVSSPFSFSLPPAGSWRSHGWKYALEHSAPIHRSSGGSRASSYGRRERWGVGSASLSAMPREIDLERDSRGEHRHRGSVTKRKRDERGVARACRTTECGRIAE